MGIMDKLKGFFYDEEEIEEVEIPKKVKQTERKVNKIDKNDVQDIPERELFRAERTFNFPMDMDEEDFIPVKSEIKHERKESNNVEPKKDETEIKREYISSQIIKPYSAKVEKKEEKKFKPTPIISPIYGIVDGSVLEKKETSSVSETKDFSVTKKIDFDTVRKKAYGDIHADEEENENKGLFFNLVEDDKKTEDLSENLKDELVSSDADEIKITYNDVNYDTEESDLEDEIEVPKISRSKKNKVELEENEEDAILSETKEQDLFNLIDNMYNSEEDEEEE